MNSEEISTCTSEEEKEEDLIGLLDALAVGKATWYDHVHMQRGDKVGRLVLTERRLAFYFVESNASEFKVKWSSIARFFTSRANPQKPMLKLISLQDKALKFTLKDVGDLERIKVDVHDRLAAAKMTKDRDMTAPNNNKSTTQDPLQYLESLIMPANLGGLGSVVMVSVMKDKGSLVGLILGHNPQDRMQRLCIVKIVRSSLLADTALKEGFEILYINRLDCQDGKVPAKTAAKLIQQTSGQLTIVARNLPKQINRNANEAGLSANAMQRSIRIQMGTM